MADRNLLRAISRGEVIPFVGAGVPMEVRLKGKQDQIFPDWRGLLLKGADLLRENGKDYLLVEQLVKDETHSDYLVAAKVLIEKLDTDWPDFIKRVLKVDQSKVVPQSLDLARSIWKIGSRLIVTTNYDSVLSWACMAECGISPELWEIEDKPGQAKALMQGVDVPTVWHLHGSIADPNTIILTPEGYSHLYPGRTDGAVTYEAAIETLRTFFRTKTILFIGFSFGDKFLQKEIKKAEDLFDGYSGPHYALVRKGDEKVFRNLGSNIVPVVFEGFGKPLIEKIEELSSFSFKNPSKELEISTPENSEDAFDSFASEEYGKIRLWQRIPVGQNAEEKVSIQEPFWLAAVPITCQQFNLFLESVGREGKRDANRPSHPAEDVAWWEAIEFCDWLSVLSTRFRGARLPTADEWEYSCRAGTSSKFWCGNEASEVEKSAWVQSNSQGVPHAVATKPPNQFGLFDMHGNVREWTASVWRTNRAGVGAASFEDVGGAARILKGGSYLHLAEAAASSSVSVITPGEGLGATGIRVLLPSNPY